MASPTRSSPTCDPPRPAPSSSSSSRHVSRTQKALSSFARGRPLPYGSIPLHRSSVVASLTKLSSSPPDVNLSGIEGFDYDESWALGTHPFTVDQKGKAKASSLPLAILEDDGIATTTRDGSSSLSRSSTVSSRRSSTETRRPRLLQQSVSPPTPSSHVLNITSGRASLSARASKSLAEKGESSALPSLYNVSRGRSEHVSPGRHWGERRGASASVLSGASDSDGKHKQLPRKSKGGRIKSRENSAGSLETPLFSSDDGLSSSEEESKVRSRGKRLTRSDKDRCRRQGLKILLEPSASRRGSSEEHAPFSQSVTTSASGEPTSLEDRLTVSSSFSSHATTGEGSDKAGLDEADDEAEEAAGASALLLRRRSRSGRRLLDHSLRSPTSPTRMSTRLEVIPAGLTPDGNLERSLTALAPVKDVLPVEGNADPLLGSAVGSVSDMIAIDPIVWTDAQTQRRKQSVAEQEKERRVGFAAAYQQRLTSLLWSRKPPSAAAAKADESESLFTTSWRHLTTLPNMLMPTLGVSKKNSSAEAELEAKREQALSAAQDAVADEMRSLPSTPSVGKDSSSLPSPALDGRGRGVLNPLEGDSDVSAYVPGLGSPIDPDLELSSVVHLQTFRTKLITAPRSRKGCSLERPSSAESLAGAHRRSYSDNQMTPPALELLLEGRPCRTAERERQPGRSSIEESEERKCSRPAVQAPVPGGFSAYNSSESGEESGTNDEAKVRSSGDKERRSSRRGRSSKTRRRSCSPSGSRKQCAIGLFDSKKSHTRSRTSEEEIGEVPRVRSTPNLVSLAHRQRRQRPSKQNNGGRGRAGSVKVVSASVGCEQVEFGQPVTTAMTPVLSMASQHQGALGLGLPGSLAAGRPSMVSNGAHLLMLSLEMEMMRHRKITCSLKPRWLKARVRSESNIQQLNDEALDNVQQMAVPLPWKPRSGSSLRFEVQ